MTVFIQDACRATGLTKKAVGYYCEQGLLTPGVFENGYRTFGREDVETLRKIAVLRKLGLSTQEISAVLKDSDGGVLRQCSTKAQLELETGRRRQAILQELSNGAAYADAYGALEALERETAIGQRLMDAFPPFLGTFIRLHFSRFLTAPVTGARQEAAYRRILAFLDEMPGIAAEQNIPDLPALAEPETLREIVADYAAQIGELLQDPRAYIQNHRQMLEKIIAERANDAYRQTPSYAARKQMRTLMEASGYAEVFLPAMKELSPAYAEYAAKLEEANRIFLEYFPGSQHL